MPKQIMEATDTIRKKQPMLTRGEAVEQLYDALCVFENRMSYPVSEKFTELRMKLQSLIEDGDLDE